MLAGLARAVLHQGRQGPRRGRRRPGDGGGGGAAARGAGPPRRLPPARRDRSAARALAPGPRPFRHAQTRRRPPVLRRPDRPCRARAARSRQRLGAVQARWRPRPRAAGRGAGQQPGAVAHRRRADGGVLRRRGRRARARRRKPRKRGAGPSSRWATSSSPSTASRAPTPPASAVGAPPSRSASAAARASSARCRSPPPSAPPRRCWPSSTRCSPRTPARQGVVPEGEALHHRADREGHAGAVELWPLLRRAAKPKPLPWLVPEQPEQVADAPALLAEARRRAHRPHAGPRAPAGARRPAPRCRHRPRDPSAPPHPPRRRAGARPPPHRLRAAAGARAQGTARAGRRRGPPGAGRADRGAGPARALRRAAAAGGRPPTRRAAEVAADRPVGGRAVRPRPRARRLALGGALEAARGGAEHAGGSRRRVDRLPASPRRSRHPARAAGRGAGRALARRPRPGSDERPGAALVPPRPRRRRPARRGAERGAHLRARAPAEPAGLRPLAATRRRAGEARGRERRRRGADHDRARRQGAARRRWWSCPTSAPATRSRWCAGRKRAASSCRSGRRAGARTTSPQPISG